MTNDQEDKQSRTPFLGSEKQTRFMWLIAAVVVPLLAALISRGSSSSSPTAIQTTPSALRGVATQASLPTRTANGDIAFQVLYSNEKALTIYVESESNLGYLSINALETSVIPWQTFEVLQELGGIAQAGMCFRYVLNDVDIPTSKRCDENLVFEQRLDQSDVFWYDFQRNILLDTALYWQDTLLGLCPAANPRCEFAESF